MGVVTTILDALERFMASITPTLNQLVLFILILFIGFLAGKILSRLIRKLMTDAGADDAGRKRLGLKFSITKTVAGTIAGVFYVGSVLLVLDAIGFATTAIQIVLLIIAIALVTSTFLLLRDSLPNLIAGLSLRKTIKRGVYLRAATFEGEVLSTGLWETVIVSRRGDTLLIPNNTLKKTTLTLLKRKPAKAGGGEP